MRSLSILTGALLTADAVPSVPPLFLSRNNLVMRSEQSVRSLRDMAQDSAHVIGGGTGECPSTCSSELCRCVESSSEIASCASEISAVCQADTLSDCMPDNYVDYYRATFCPMAQCLDENASQVGCNCQFYQNLCESYPDGDFGYCNVARCCQNEEDDMKGQEICLDAIGKAAIGGGEDPSDSSQEGLLDDTLAKLEQAEFEFQTVGEISNEIAGLLFQFCNAALDSESCLTMNQCSWTRSDGCVSKQVLATAFGFTELPPQPPTVAPSEQPVSQAPISSEPSKSPVTARPTEIPTFSPTATPSLQPVTASPTSKPSNDPTSSEPSKSPVDSKAYG
ncbi:hypothetical protein THAOC_15530, partial [Thalassiosira oceanica]